MSAIVSDKILHDDEEGRWVEAKLALTLGEIIDMDIEALNDFAEENILVHVPPGKPGGLMSE